MNFLKLVIVKTKLIKFIAVAIILFPINLFAHEFWLEPENFNTSSESSIIHIKIGTGFIGTEFGFNKKFKDRLYKENNKEGRINLEQEDGSFPAFNFNLSEKFNIITYINNFTLLRYRSLKGFENFLEEQNLTEIIQDYDRNKIPTEHYKRFAKTILNFNKPEFFVEKPTLDFEIIVKDKSDQNLLKLGIFLNGVAVKNWPIEIFSKDKNNKIFVEKLITDKNGNFNLSLLKDRFYLINSVYVFKTKDKPELQLNSDWVSYWASLTLSN